MSEDIAVELVAFTTWFVQDLERGRKFGLVITLAFGQLSSTGVCTAVISVCVSATLCDEGLTHRNTWSIDSCSCWTLKKCEYLFFSLTYFNKE